MQEPAFCVLALPRLYAILDLDACAAVSRAPLDVANAFFDGGARLVQVRAKHAPSGPLLDLIASIVERGRTTGAVVVVNDRADLAALAGAWGVHVGQDDLPVAAVRTIAGTGACIGLSTHTAAQLAAAAPQGADYLAIGPVFATHTKATGYEAVGLAMVHAAAAPALRQGVPLVAIGGITLASATAVIAAGATSVAVIGDLLAGDPGARVRAFLAALK